MKAIPLIQEPKSFNTDQNFNFWYDPHYFDRHFTDSYFRAYRSILRLLQKGSKSIREISKETGISESEMPEMISKLAIKNLIKGDGHKVVNGINEVQLQLNF